MKPIYTTIDINASPEVIWQVIVNFEAYESWNPFIVRSKAEGKANLGVKITNSMKMENKEQVFEPVITEWVENKHLGWLGRLFVPGLFDGHHEFILEKKNFGTRLIHKESFSGLMAPVILKMIRKQTERGFLQMNQALKRVVETENPMR